MIEKILATYKGWIEAQDAKQQDLEKRFERKNYDQVALKGRMGTLEKNLKELKGEYESSAASQHGGSFSAGGSNSASEVGAFLADELQQLQLRIINLEVKGEDAIKELDDKCSALSAVVESGGHDAVAPVGWATVPELKPPKASTQDIVSALQSLQKRRGNTNCDYRWT